MNRSLLPTDARQLLPQERAPESLPPEALPARWGSRAFYVLSALIHIAAAVALSGTWMLGTTTRDVAASTPDTTPPKPTIARMAIDVGPVKFCEMKIEQVVGLPHEPARR
jgi:hypothetical protein